MRIDDVNQDYLGGSEQLLLIKQGLEIKFFPFANGGGLFGRLGISDNQLDSKSPQGKLKGIGYYRGIGWDIPTLSGKLGQALEAAWRDVAFDQLDLKTYSPSIGVHFYGYI